MEQLRSTLIIFIGLFITVGRRSVDQQQTLVLARLQDLTTLKMEPAVSEAWNERRIIRTRLQAYGSK